MGYLHLDIKPDNILIGTPSHGKLCLIDYGISEKYLGDDNEHLKSKELDYV